MRPVKILIRLRECAGWSDSLLGSHMWRYIFWYCAFMYNPRKGHLCHIRGNKRQKWSAHSCSFIMTCPLIKLMDAVEYIHRFFTCCRMRRLLYVNTEDQEQPVQPQTDQWFSAVRLGYYQILREGERERKRDRHTHTQTERTILNQLFSVFVDSSNLFYHINLS